MEKSLKITLWLLVVFIVCNNLYFFPQNILSWDVFGYYLYLPLQFIYHDLGLKDIAAIEALIEQYDNTSSFYQVLKTPNGNYVMKYSMGLAVVYAPFFFIAHALAPAMGYAADGFSFPYQAAIFTCGLLYTLAGIYFLCKVLRYFFTDGITAWLLALIVLGTNYIIHISMYGQNAMSHNYLFTLYAAILWRSIQWHKTQELKHMVWLGIACGLAILMRPSEIVCLLIPLFWGVYDIGSLKEKVKLLWAKKQQVIYFSLILLAFGSTQFIYWKIYTGKFFYNSYGGNAGEGFEFLSPYILQVLFSFRKGWLVYTPIMAFAIWGFVYLYKNNKAVFTPLFIYFLCNVYVVSSWSCWWYAQSFSQRAMIPSYPIMAIALGYLLTHFQTHNTSKRVLGFGIVSLLLGLNIFQTIQFHHGVIHNDRMTAAYYLKTFGRLSINPEDKKLLLVNRDFAQEETFEEDPTYQGKLLKQLTFEELKESNPIAAAHGRYCKRLDSAQIYSPYIEAVYKDLTQKDHVWFKISAWVYPTGEGKENLFSLVAHFNHKGYAYKYKTFDSDKMNLKVNQWNRVTYYYLSPEVRKPENTVRILFWLQGKPPVYIDDLKVEVFEKKE